MEKKEVKAKVAVKTKTTTEAKTESKLKATGQEKIIVKSKSVAPKPKKVKAEAGEPRVYATGKRKTAVAKVWMTKGTGKILINGKNLADYFQRPAYKMVINQPFALLKVEDTFDVNCQVLGSGLSGQAGAIRHGISKALNEMNEEFRQALRSGGFLTRDSRKVERKKYGQPKARKKFQFSKR